MTWHFDPNLTTEGAAPLRNELVDAARIGVCTQMQKRCHQFAQLLEVTGQNGVDQFVTRECHTGKGEGCCRRHRQFVRTERQVDAGANDNGITGCCEFRQNSADLESVNLYIVWPFQSGSTVTHERVDRERHGNSRDEWQPTEVFSGERFSRGQNRTQKNGRRKGLAGRRDPGSTESAATGRLVECDNGREVRFSAIRYRPKERVVR